MLHMITEKSQSGFLNSLPVLTSELISNLLAHGNLSDRSSSSLRIIIEIFNDFENDLLAPIEQGKLRSTVRHIKSEESNKKFFEQLLSSGENVNDFVNSNKSDALDFFKNFLKILNNVESSYSTGEGSLSPLIFRSFNASFA